MKAIQLLNRMILDDLCARHPELTHGQIGSAGKMKCNSANSLTQCVKKFLTIKGHQCDRVNNQGRRIDQTQVVTDILGFKRQIGSVKYVPGTGTKGKADLSAKIRRRPTDEFAVPVEIEIKWNKDRQSQVQKQFEQQTVKAGGVYLLIHSLEEFVEWYGGFVITPC